ncbi:MAG TPA: diphosphomevalonate decarboxylase [Labilithrix sp.]
MRSSARAVAHPNIALAKYWGKLDARTNVPAVPSLSVTLAGMATTTTVTFDDALKHDGIRIDGEPAVGRPRDRVIEMLDRIRKEARIECCARVESQNDFPTASGLASSASGFAALALAASRAAGFDWSAERVAELARTSSASAARSMFGGFAELDGGPGARGAARQVAPADALDLRVLVCVTNEGPKLLSSTDGMNASATTSPYWDAWIALAPKIHQRLRAALLDGDFQTLGELAEQSAFAMHACALAAGIVYTTDATFAAIREVRALRASGVPAFATVDAGPHVKCLVRGVDAEVARRKLVSAPGVLRVVETQPGEGARVLEASS